MGTEQRLYTSAMLASGRANRLSDVYVYDIRYHRGMMARLDNLPSFHAEHVTKTWTLLKQFEIRARITRSKSGDRAFVADKAFDRAMDTYLDFIVLTTPS